MNSTLSASRRLLVVNGYSLSIPGQGIGVYTIRLLKGLLRALPPESLRVVVPEPLIPYAKCLPESVVERVSGNPPQRGNQLLHDIYWASRLGAYVKLHYKDCIFHCPREYYSWTSPERTVTTIHDCNHWIFKSSRGSLARAWWRRATERFAAKRSPLVLTVSNWARRDLVKIAKIPDEKIRVIYNWTDSEVTRSSALARLPEVRSRLALPLRYFLYVGGFSANKNIDALFRAYAQASSMHDLPPLVAAGDLGQYQHAFGRELRQTLQSIKFPLEKLVTPGFVPTIDLPAVMAGASLLIYPSKSEGFGYPPVEALSLGTPVLVADATSMTEVVRNATCRFSPEDENDLIAKLAQSAADSTSFRCELPKEFTEAYGIQHYLSVMNTLGMGVESEAVLLANSSRTRDF